MDPRNRSSEERLREVDTPPPRSVQGEIVNEEETEIRQRLTLLAWLFDQAIPIPGLNIRIGLDGLMGLIPGVGDVASAAVSTYLIAEASRMGVSKAVLMRMSGNVLIDTLMGSIPIVGDVFDFAWKANSRNVKLLNQYLDQPQRVQRSSRLFVAGLIAVIIASVVGLLVFFAAIVAWLIQVF